MDALHSQGEIIADRYQIVTTLGQGGMGTTYAAVDLEENNQRVAIKAVSMRQAQDWKIVELFEREAKVLATLKHPAIPNYLNSFHCDTESDRYFYLVQELVEGESIAALVNRGWKLNEKHVKYIATQILNILKYLHSLHPPVIHRDIKPQNIIVRPDGKVYLVDFGAVQEIYRNTLSFGGTFVGTMGYMSPEQFRGKVIPASDLYSLGCTLLFLLTHRSPTDLPQKRMRFDFRDRLSLSPNFADWLEKMVEPASEDRFLSAGEALQALQQKSPLAVTKKAQLRTSYQFRRIRKPLNTRVIVKRSDRNLSVTIPPIIELPELDFFKPDDMTLATKIVLGAIGMFLGPILIFGFAPILFIAIPVTLILFHILCRKIELDINSESFSITHSTVNYQSKIIGKTREITFVELEDSRSKNGTSFYCVIWEHKKKHRIGETLSRVENIWIVEEISDFLEGLQMQVV
ncbi:serine/threonine-protein kinase [Spirulina sp. 06S082]|uniref:serine/threonine protein kinase n=1 Tax=Spirulina sp. 06S082 TaxID=3110248 RepID=UPI002B20F876|nr:serine/threonine-protein kinase [Spirulina sp. 06S082]MEA5470429.1 serine/threonine-protein kinase [Spirulina sp. 06S082]